MQDERQQPGQVATARSADAYFAGLGRALAAHGRGVPRLVIDLARFEANIDRATSLVAPGALRLVVKSLPAPALLAHAMARSGTRKLMSFHLPFLRQAAEHFPEADILLGKPLPMAAVAAFYDLPPRGRFDPVRQLHWLADTPQRIAAMDAFAASRGLSIGIALELDVGMRRGGVADVATLDTMLGGIAASQGRLRLDGFMGYDAHAAKAPWPGSPRAAVRSARACLAALLEHARATHPALWRDDLIINGAGSPTFPMHEEGVVLNDISLGSVLLKPTDFDLPQLQAFQPAAFIAAPVLKRLRGVRLPFLEWAARLTGAGEDTLFIYGGRWMARPVWPEGLRANPLYGLSSNQQMMCVPRQAAVGPEDCVFLRPTQSEAVLLQFGDLLAVRGEQVEARWPVLQQEG